MEKITTIVITGAQGFVGKNLFATLQNRPDIRVIAIDRKSSITQLEDAIKQADIIYHLAGVNRPQDPQEFMQGNFNYSESIINLLAKHHSQAKLVVSSSIQAENNNPYGLSKKAMEDAFIHHAKKTQQPLFIYRLVNVFGKWAKPHYNSVIATFCYAISRGEPIQIHDENAPIRMIYIDDLVEEFISILTKKEPTLGTFLSVQPEYGMTVGELAKTLQQFHHHRQKLVLETQANPLIKKLYATYLSYLDTNNFAYELTMHHDARGSFTELIKSLQEGQISVNISKPGITKGNHYHHTKNEKFIVVSGQASIKFRKVGTSNVIEYRVDGDHMRVVDIPPGYTHNITNIGEHDLVTIMWASEFFDPQRPDTYPMEVDVQ